MPKTTVYIALAIGAQEPANPAYVVFESPYRFVSGATVVLPEPAPVALNPDGTGSVAVDPGVWLVTEVLPTQTLRRAVYVPESIPPVQYADLLEVTQPADVGYAPTWAALAQAAAAATALALAEVRAIAETIRGYIPKAPLAINRYSAANAPRQDATVNLWICTTSELIAPLNALDVDIVVHDSAAVLPPTPPWSLSSVPGLYFDFNAETIERTDGQSVSGFWNDPVSGLSLSHITTPAAVMDVDGFNGHKAVYFPNDGALQIGGIPNYTGPWTIFALVKFDNPADGDFAFDAVDAGGTPLKLGLGALSGTFRIQRGATLTGQASDALPNLFELVFNGTTSSIQVGDAAATAGTTTAGEGINALVVGGRGGNTNRLTGKIARIVGIKGTVSSADRTQIRALLKTQGGL